MIALALAELRAIERRETMATSSPRDGQRMADSGREDRVMSLDSFKSEPELMSARIHCKASH